MSWHVVAWCVLGVLFLTGVVLLVLSRHDDAGPDRTVRVMPYFAIGPGTARVPARSARWNVGLGLVLYPMLAAGALAIVELSSR